MIKFVAYYRVSTDGQEQSGLGLDGQRTTVLNYAKDGFIIAEFTEIESGKKNRRPELLKALKLAKRENATLLIAKLDRLSRSVSFIFSLKDAKIDFTACDIPEANTMNIGIMATMAQYEREIISLRTKLALNELKKKGVKLGSDSFKNTEIQGRAFKASLETRQTKARENENNIKAYTLAKALKNAKMKPAQIVTELNKAGFKTSTGKDFQIVQVQRLFNLFESNE